MHGLELVTEVPFVTQLQDAEGIAGERPVVGPFGGAIEYFLSIAVDAPLEPGAPRSALPPPSSVSAHILPSGEPHWAAHRLVEQDLVRFSQIAEFELSDGAIRGRLLADDHRTLAELRLLGPVMAFWLERRGGLVFHGSAVVPLAGEHAEPRAEAGCLLFLGEKGAGKSSTAAAFLANGGALLGDDIVTVTGVAVADGPVAWSSYPEMRMEPLTVRRFVGDPSSFDRVLSGLPKRRIPVLAGRYGRFHPGCASLRAVVVLAGTDGRAARSASLVEPISQAEAVIELVRHSYTPRLCAGAHSAANRFAALARLVRRVPVLRATLPRDLDALPRSVEQLQAEVLAVAGTAAR